MMNTIYVLVSLLVLSVLIGYNHAHGLTTFGKSQDKSTQDNNGTNRPCTVQANCTFIRGTTCLKGSCLCGDNSQPKNGKCQASHQGPQHICNSTLDCVSGAECISPLDKDGANKTPMDKICVCQDGLSENHGLCGGSTSLDVTSKLTFIWITLVPLTWYYKILD